MPIVTSRIVTPKDRMPGTKKGKTIRQKVIRRNHTITGTIFSPPLDTGFQMKNTDSKVMMERSFLGDSDATYRSHCCQRKIQAPMDILQSN